MSGWSPKRLLKEPLLILANSAAVPVAPNFSISADGAMRAMVIGVYVSGVAGTSTVQLQHSLGFEVWENVTGKVTAALVNGWNYIKINSLVAGDAALLPLYDVGRLVLTSNGTGAGSISSIVVLQEI